MGNTLEHLLLPMSVGMLDDYQQELKGMGFSVTANVINKKLHKAGHERG